jgi:hypothetical protein
MRIEDDAHVFKKVGRHLFAFDVDPAEHLGCHLQPSGRFGLCHELPGDLHRVKRHALAGARHMGKQSVLDRVVLGAVRRIVRDADLQPKAIGQALQRLLEHMAIRRVRAAPVAQQQQPLCIGVVFAAVLAPPLRDGVAAQLARLRARVQVQVPLVARQIVQTVRDQLAQPCAGEIMIKRLHLRLRVGLALTGEVADQLLFLRVDADHRLASGQIPSLELGDVFMLVRCDPDARPWTFSCTPYAGPGRAF